MLGPLINIDINRPFFFVANAMEMHFVIGLVFTGHAQQSTKEHIQMSWAKQFFIPGAKVIIQLRLFLPPVKAMANIRFSGIGFL